MWSGEAGGGRGEEARSAVLSGYDSLPALVTDLGREVAGWGHLTQITVRLWWQHPEARRKGEKLCGSSGPGAARGQAGNQ
ncbi:MAG: hypothetical protein WC443_13075 [Desulfobaccales bacterium]